MSWSYSPNESSASATKSCFAFNVEYMRMAFIKNMQKSVFNVFAGLLNGDKKDCPMAYKDWLQVSNTPGSLHRLLKMKSLSQTHNLHLLSLLIRNTDTKLKEIHVSEWYLSFISCAENRHNADTPTHTTSSLPDLELSSFSS